MVKTRVRLAVALLAGALALAPSAALAEDGTDAHVSVRSVDVSHFPLVALTISTSASTSFAPGDVALVENGVPVRLSSVEALGDSGDRVDAVLAIDVSNSMAGLELETALAAARTFLQGVPPDMPVGVVAFAGAAEVRSPVTDDRPAVEAAVTSMATTTTQGTALYEAVAAAAGMFGEGGDGQHNLILLTDGRNTTGAIDLEGAVAAAEAADVAVYTIGLAGPETDQTTLQALASRTGGSFASITPQDLTGVYAGLARELSEQALVTYRSKAPYGVPVSVEVTVPIGTGSTRFLSPGLSTLPEEGGGTTSPLASPVAAGVIAFLVFLAAFNLSALFLRSRERRRREAQLRSRLVNEFGEAARRDALEADPGAAWVPRTLAEAAERTAGSTRYASTLAGRLTRAGWSLHVGEFLVVVGLALVGGLAAGALAFGPMGALAGAAIGATLPVALLSRAAAKRGSKIQSQLADTMMVIAASLRAGHSFLQALDTATREVSEPAATEFNRTMTEIRFGRDVDEALDALAERVGSRDLEWAVTAIKIQRKVGGNLAEVLEIVAKTIRERETLRRQVRVLSAEGRISVAVLTVLPIMIAAYLMAVNPDYLRVLTTTRAGIVILLAAGMLMVIGYVWMQRIVRLDDV
jgi:tight adherence protein B